MKKITFFCSLALTGLFCNAQIRRTNTKMPSDTNYCASSKGGDILVQLNGKTIKSEILLSDSTRITIQGKVIRRDGSSRILKNGDCINKNGIISEKSKSEGMLEN